MYYEINLASGTLTTKRPADSFISIKKFKVV
jgi:hypothetical protein